MIDSSTFRLDGRVALVTGSSTGIGFALARGLGQAGATVVVNGRDKQRMQAAADTLRGEGLSVHSSAFDVNDVAAVDAAVAAIEAEVGAVDILVNNAGGTRRGAFHEFSMADWRSVMSTNLDGVFVVGLAVAKRMVPRGRGAAARCGRNAPGWKTARPGPTPARHPKRAGYPSSRGSASRA